MTNTVTLIDTPGLVCRSYYAIPTLTTSTGIPTNAVYGFAKTILGFLRDEKPTHVGMAFDLNGRVGRQQIDQNYKANRDSANDSLKTQFGLVIKMCEYLGLHPIMCDGWEADDVVGTMTKKALSAGFNVEIITSDKDFQQLLEPGVRLWDPAKRVYATHADIPAKYGVRADQMRDYQTLIGDSIDNVPNVPGIGPKTAVKLLNQFNSIDEMIMLLHQIKPDKVRETILNHTAQITMARQLVTFRSDLPGLCDIDGLKRDPIDMPNLTKLLDELEFSRRLMPLIEGVDV